MMAALTIAAVTSFCGTVVLVFIKGKDIVRWPRMYVMPAALALFGLWFGWIVALNLEAEKNEPVWAEGEKAVEWDRSKVPLGVCLIGDLGSHNDSAKAAVKQFNGYVGFTLFEYRSARCDIEIKEGSIEVGTEREDDIANTWYDKAREVCVVKFAMGGVNITMSACAFTHELGHCVGLAHDPSGLMKRNACNSRELPIPVLSRPDEKALNARYNPKE